MVYYLHKQETIFILEMGGFMIDIDMWYDDKKEQVTGLDIFFNDLGCFYSGNLRIFKKTVGDYRANSVQEIEKVFPHLEEKIKSCFSE